MLKSRIRAALRALAGRDTSPAPPVVEYATHFVLLAGAVHLSRDMGPVLELGMGYYSTPLLHRLCGNDRHLVSADTNADWYGRFAGFASPSHELHLVKSWPSWQVIESRHWAVAFVDCQPGEGRAEVVRRLRPQARFVVVHDTETDYDTGADYKLEPVFAEFRYRNDYRFLRPYTTVVSDEAPFALSEVETVWTPPRR